MLSGKQKHMLAAYIKDTDEYRILGYFTSKISPVVFSKKQIKVFQDKLDNPNAISSNNKVQYFVPFDIAESISSDNVNVVACGGDYIQMSNQTGYLKKILEQNDMNPYKNFNYDGISKEDCINMCLEYDSRIKNKTPQPITEEQDKLNKLNIENQKNAQLLKKNKKLQNKDNNEVPKHQ